MIIPDFMRPFNFFDTEYLKADLKGRSVRGGIVILVPNGPDFVSRWLLRSSWPAC